MFALYLLNTLSNLDDMTLQEFNHRMIGANQSLTNYSLSLTSNKDDANDLLQDTYLKVLTNKDKFDPSTNMKAWTHVIMKNTFINNYRKSRRENNLHDYTDDSYYINQGQTNHSYNHEYDYDSGKIMEHVKGMDNDQSSVFIMNMKGYKYKEIAEKMNLPIGTVKSRIFLTRRKIAERFKDYSN
jgi:RNA polymerase sigma-70 factor (ECF subfamily)